MRSLPMALAIGNNPCDSDGGDRILFVNQSLPTTVLARKTNPPIAETKAIRRTEGGLVMIENVKRSIYLLPEK
jgi:hypothetical protein